MLNETKIERRFPKHPAVPKTYVKRKNDMSDEYRKFARYLDDSMPDGRLKALALTNLEQSAMFALKGIDDEANAKAAKARKMNKQATEAK